MTQSGDMDCLEKLLHPARIVLKTGRPIRHESIEYRIALWNELRSSLDRFMREECGIFLEEVDLHVRSQFDAALVALASAFLENGEDFPQASRFSSKEIGIWQKIDRYAVMDLLSQEEIRNRVIGKESGLLDLLRDYYVTMKEYVWTTLEDPEIRITLRYYLKRRWNGYRGKMDAAIASAVLELEWMQQIVEEWENATGSP